MSGRCRSLPARHDAVTGLFFGLEHRRAQDELMQMPPDLSDLFTPNPEPTRALLGRHISQGLSHPA